jgi:hypothetical protein
VSGLSSGEGLIAAVKDIDPLSGDKRLLAVESEFGKPLKVMKRDGNILSDIVRQAWDSGDLRILNKNTPIAVTGAHVSIIGHITIEDLRAVLQKADEANGFGNRFLWVLAKRSKLLPEGGALTDEELCPLTQRLHEAVSYARGICELTRDAAARELWLEVYPELSAGRLGAYGAITARAEAQVMRIAGIYALMDHSARIRVEHLRAALAVWRYCDDSARFIFKNHHAKSSIRNRLKDGLLCAPDGLTKTDIRDLFHRNVDAAVLMRELEAMQVSGDAHSKRDTAAGGRPPERWFYGPATNEQCVGEPAA